MRCMKFLCTSRLILPGLLNDGSIDCGLAVTQAITRSLLAPWLSLSRWEQKWTKLRIWCGRAPLRWGHRMSVGNTCKLSRDSYCTQDCPFHYGVILPPISIVLFTPYQTLISWRYIIISFYVLKLCTNEASMPNLWTYFQCWFLKTCICIKRGVIWWLWAGLKAKRLSFSYFLCKMNRSVIFCHFSSVLPLCHVLGNKYWKITEN